MNRDSLGCDCDMRSSKFPVIEFENNINGPIDVFICCGSFEARCRTVADKLLPANVQHVLVVENKNLSAYVGENAKYLRDKFGAKTVDIATDSTNSVLTADNLQNALKEISSGKPQSFLVDITTFRHESLLILLHLLYLSTKSTDTILLIYTTASDYSVGDAVENKWLSKGIEKVRTVLGYPGDISPSNKMHLILLVGFEYQRASKLIEILEPSIISMGSGAMQSSTDDKHVASQEFFSNLLRRITATHGNVNWFEFSCNDPISTKNAILMQKQKYPSYNTLVAPMNTKLSTIGAGLATFEDSRIQICYTQATQYNYQGYSSPGTNFYLFELPREVDKTSKSH